MKDLNRFTERTKTTLAKRAGYRCSNPNCSTTTTGPHTEDDKSIGLGEAAHIRGANPGSARYYPEMTSEERSVITNGIWLCRNCARLIDTDERRYSVDLLYEWKYNHESQILSEIENQGVADYERRQITELFKSESPAARQLAADRPDCWEYLLTTELLRYKLNIVKKRIAHVSRGLEFRRSHVVSESQLFNWFHERVKDIDRLISETIAESITEINTSWGEPGVPGDPVLILAATNLMVSGCDALVDWELDVRSAIVPKDFEIIQSEMMGWKNDFIQEMDKIPKEMTKIFSSSEKPEGVFNIKLVFDVPKDFLKTHKKALKIIERLMN